MYKASLCFFVLFFAFIIFLFFFLLGLQLGVSTSTTKNTSGGCWSSLCCSFALVGCPLSGCACFGCAAESRFTFGQRKLSIARTLARGSIRTPLSPNSARFVSVGSFYALNINKTILTTFFELKSKRLCQHL